MVRITALLAASCPAFAEFTVRKIADSVVDSEALTLGEGQFGEMRFGKAINGLAFQQDAAITHDGYEVVGLLGQGGMGAVFKAFDRSLNRFVAIKLLLPHLAESAAARKRFARKGQAIAAVVDDHVMAVHAVDQWQGIPYLVMTYSRGASLQKRLEQEGSLELREILRIGLQTARGLAAAHAQGIVT